MCWRQVSKLQKAVFVIVFYFTIYVFISYSIAPETLVTFVREDMRIGDKYSLIFLIAPSAPVFSDAEAASVFTARRCGRCIVTNNQGFLPMSEYDAVLVLGPRGLMAETSAFMDPGKRYLMEATRKCIWSRMRSCEWEPRMTSFSTKESFDLCGLCGHLQKGRGKS